MKLSIFILISVLAICQASYHNRRVTLVKDTTSELVSLCESQKRIGTFFIPYPRDNRRYIQCDEFGGAFLKTCSHGMIFTERMTCEKVAVEVIEPVRNVVDIRRPISMERVRPIKRPISRVESKPVINGEYSEYNYLCESKVNSGIFYLPHPTNNQWYIQCDAAGIAYLRMCDYGTVFTAKLTCEKVEVVEEPVASIVRPIVRKPVRRPVIEIAESADYSYLCESHVRRGFYYVPHPTDSQWYIQCDDAGNAFLKMCEPGTVFTHKLTCEAIVELKETISRPVVSIERPRPSMISRVEKPAVSDDYSYLCESTLRRGVYYVAHPTNNQWYIQCDEAGNAFLKMCDFGTVFTRNLACEVVADVMPSKTISRPIMREEIVRPVKVESSEYSYLCERTVRSGIYYLPHPTDNQWYIQCDESGVAFLKMCAYGTVFTDKLTCEKVEELSTVALDASYGMTRRPLLGEDITPSPEYDYLCERTVRSEIFYVPHPTDNQWYIQCDESGRAFLKMCRFGTVFTAKLTCEKVTELYNDVMVRQPTLNEEVTQESPEFNHLCESRNGVFYLPHPTDNQWYIQCDAFDKAYLKMCSYGTVFTSNMACEKVEETPIVHERVERPIVRVERPVFHERVRVERPVFHERVRMERPVIQERVRVERPVVQERVRVERPIVRQQTSYGY